MAKEQKLEKQDKEIMHGQLMDSLNSLKLRGKLLTKPQKMQVVLAAYSSLRKTMDIPRKEDKEAK